MYLILTEFKHFTCTECKLKDALILLRDMLVEKQKQLVSEENEQNQIKTEHLNIAINQGRHSILLNVYKHLSPNLLQKGLFSITDK